MKNRLIDDITRDELHNISGHPMNEKRCSGRTTGLALKYIGEAMTDPGHRITLLDHYRSSLQSSIMMADIVRMYSKKLDLKFLDIRKIKDCCYLTYNVFEKEDPRKEEQDESNKDN